jgi:hypothetical protein
VFSDAANVVFDSTIRYDGSFFRGSTGSCRVSRGSTAIEP